MSMRLHHTRARAQLRRFWRDRSAGPALEFALTAPILATLIMGIVAVGFEASARIDVREAVRAGAHVVMSGVDDTTAIEQAVFAALGDSSEGYAVDVTERFECAGVVVPELTPLCPDLSFPERLFTIALTAEPDAAYAGSPAMASSMEVRIR